MNISEKEYKWMIEQIVSDLIDKLIVQEKYDFARAFETVYTSDTYQALLNPQTNLYSQSSGYVYSFLLSEIKTGKMG